jgi:hypothetical protein
MSKYIPIGRHQVENFVSEKAQVEAAARELFDAYIVALPDKDDWHGHYGWRVGNEHVEITVDAKGIEYHTEYTSHCDSESFYLNLPLSALYDQNFLADEVVRWAEAKENKAALILQEEKIAKQKKLESDRKMYEHLMKHFDPEIYERMKHTENQS